MEVSCSAGSQGSSTEPDVCTTSCECLTGLKEEADCDTSILTETSDVLKKIVDDVENQSTECGLESSAKVTSAEINDNIIQEFVEKYRDETNSHFHLKETITIIRLKTDDDLSVTESNASTDQGNLEANLNAVVNLNEGTLLKSNESAFLSVEERRSVKESEGTNLKINLSETDKADYRTVVKDEEDLAVSDVPKKHVNVSGPGFFSLSQNSVTKTKVLSRKATSKVNSRKKRDNTSNVIDKLFYAARKGDKEDFKKLLYVNYDNIVNDYIDKGDGGSCKSSEDEDEDREDDPFLKSVEDNTEVCNEASAVEGNKPVGVSHSEPSDSQLNSLNSTLVICENLEKNSEDIGKNKNTISNKLNDEGLTLKRKKVPNFKEISRKIAIKKLKGNAVSEIDKTCVETSAISSEIVKEDLLDKNENFTGFLLSNLIANQKVSTDDNQTSSELDESFVQSELSADDTGTSDSSSTDQNLRFACQHCNKKYRNYVHLRSHQSLHHFNEDTFKCVACSSIFVTLEKLKEHEKVHVNLKTAFCELCQKAYSSKAAIRRHLATVHVVEKQRPYQCEICDFAFGCRWHLQDHMRTHTGKRDYACPICRQPFTHSGSMNRHAKEQHKFDASTGKYSKYMNMQTSLQLTSF